MKDKIEEYIGPVLFGLMIGLGLHVRTFYVEDGSLVIRAKTHNSSGAENWEDLDLLFGGEE